MCDHPILNSGLGMSGEAAMALGMVKDKVVFDEVVRTLERREDFGTKTRFTEKEMKQVIRNVRDDLIHICYYQPTDMKKKIFIPKHIKMARLAAEHERDAQEAKTQRSPI